MLLNLELFAVDGMAGNIINRLSYYVIKLHQYSHIEIYGMKTS